MIRVALPLRDPCPPVVLCPLSPVPVPRIPFSIGMDERHCMGKGNILQLGRRLNRIEQGPKDSASAHPLLVHLLRGIKAETEVQRHGASKLYIVLFYTLGYRIVGETSRQIFPSLSLLRCITAVEWQTLSLLCFVLYASLRSCYFAKLHHWNDLSYLCLFTYVSI